MASAHKCAHKFSTHERELVLAICHAGVPGAELAEQHAAPGISGGSDHNPAEAAAWHTTSPLSSPRTAQLGLQGMCSTAEGPVQSWPPPSCPHHFRMATVSATRT